MSRARNTTSKSNRASAASAARKARSASPEKVVVRRTRSAAPEKVVVRRTRSASPEKVVVRKTKNAMDNATKKAKRGAKKAIHEMAHVDEVESRVVEDEEPNLFEVEREEYMILMEMKRNYEKVATLRIYVDGEPHTYIIIRILPYDSETIFTETEILPKTIKVMTISDYDTLFSITDRIDVKSLRKPQSSLYRILGFFTKEQKKQQTTSIYLSHQLFDHENFLNMSKKEESVNRLDFLKSMERFTDKFKDATNIEPGYDNIQMLECDLNDERHTYPLVLPLLNLNDFKNRIIDKKILSNKEIIGTLYDPTSLQWQTLLTENQNLQTMKSDKPVIEIIIE